MFDLKNVVGICSLFNVTKEPAWEPAFLFLLYIYIDSNLHTALGRSAAAYETADILPWPDSIYCTCTYR